MNNDTIKLLFKTQKQILNYVNKRIMQLNIKDFSPSNGWMILYIANNADEPQNMVSLANYFCKSKANISIVAKRLIRNGYLQKSKLEGNQKNIYLELTDKGYKLTQSIRVILRDIKIEIEKIFSEEEQDLLLNHLSRLSHHLQTYMS